MKKGEREIEAMYVGAEPTCSSTQLGHLDDLLKNRLNSQQNLRKYEVWKPKCRGHLKTGGKKIL